LATTWPADWRRPLQSGRVLLGIAALALFVAGCDRGPGEGPASATGRKHFDSNGGRYAVELETRPSSIEVNQPFDVTVIVTPKSGTSKDLEILVDARMPAHFHGMNRVAKLSRSGTTWKAEGLVFHMAGHWELYVDITEGGVTERAQLDVDLK
jgi:hypothetical protein